MALQKITYANKTNPKPIVDRSKQATADDFNEIKEKVNAMVDKVNPLSPNTEVSAVKAHDYGGVTLVENNPTEGRGYADNVLFDLTKYIESESKNITGQSTGGFHSSKKPTDDEFTIVDHQSFAGSRVIETNRFLTIYSNYIPVKPGERVYGEIWAKHINGPSDRTVYFGIELYDKNLNPIAGGAGVTYFVASAKRPQTGSWEKYSNYTTIPTSHTPYNGSDGGGVYYVRVRILLNYHLDNFGVRQYGGIILKRVESNHDMNFNGVVKCTSLIQTSDKKFKTNIELIDGNWALNVFKKLKLSFYDFSLTNSKQAGLIAQEVEKILPQAVHTSDNGEKGLNHTYIDMVCKAAIQHFIKTQIQ